MSTFLPIHVAADCPQRWAKISGREFSGRKGFPDLWPRWNERSSGEGTEKQSQSNFI